MCPTNICIKIQPQFCEDNFQNCFNLTNNKKLNNLKPTCQVSIYNDEMNCINLLHKVEYVFYHNGSNGIKEVIVKMYLTNFTHKLSDEHVYFYQEFSVKFIWMDRLITYSDQRSGNPGYLTGKPILVANLLINETLINKTSGNGTENIVRKNITRNPFEFIENFMTLPTSKHGFCMYNNVTYNIVEFKFDSIQKCKFQTSVKVNKSKPANDTCRLMQRVIFDYWRISLTNTTIKVVGDFGNADVRNFSDWSSVLFYTTPDEVLTNITGRYSSKNTSLTCYNITTVLKIDIFHSRVVYKNLDNQEKIVGTIYEFAGLRNLTFDIDKNYIQLDVDIKHEVMFFDITVSKIKKYADPPTFEIKLPYDFFYPFVKLNNTEQIRVDKYLFFVILLMLYFSQYYANV